MIIRKNKIYVLSTTSNTEKYAKSNSEIRV